MGTSTTANPVSLVKVYAWTHGSRCINLCNDSGVTLNGRRPVGNFKRVYHPVENFTASKCFIYKHNAHNSCIETPATRDRCILQSFLQMRRSNPSFLPTYHQKKKKNAYCLFRTSRYSYDSRLKETNHIHDITSNIVTLHYKSTTETT